MLGGRGRGRRRWVPVSQERRQHQEHVATLKDLSNIKKKKVRANTPLHLLGHAKRPRHPRGGQCLEKKNEKNIYTYRETLLPYISCHLCFPLAISTCTATNSGARAQLHQSVDGGKGRRPYCAEADGEWGAGAGGGGRAASGRDSMAGIRRLQSRRLLTQGGDRFAPELASAAR